MQRHRTNFLVFVVGLLLANMHSSGGSSCCCFVGCQFRSRLYYQRRVQTDHCSVLSSSSSSSSDQSDNTNHHHHTGASSPGRIPITESDFPGAGSPRPELEPQDIPPLLMKALHFNDFPTVDAGLEAVWEFSGDTTKFVFGNNVTDFGQSAHDTARIFPTSFYGAALYGLSWEMETEINRVGGIDGWIATQVMKTISSDGRMRRWQWELRKRKRPPQMGCWYVESIGSSDRKGQFEPE